MDLTTVLLGAIIALGLVGTDAAWYAGSVAIEVTTPPKTETTEIDQAAVESEFKNLLTDITATKSLVDPPEITWNRNDGVGMAVATTLGMDKVAYALQAELGFSRDALRVQFYLDDGTLRALVSGTGHFSGQFGQVLTLDKGEPLMAFVRRCTLFGVSQIAPYGTAVHLLEDHSDDKDFTDVVALAEHSKAMLPPKPTSLDRSLFNNLLGLVALFKNDTKGAAAAFATAMADDPTNPVPFINAAFVDLQEDNYQSAATRMEQLLRLAPPENNVLAASAYMTWGAALLGLHQLDAADRLLAAATRAAPGSGTAFGLWADERRLQGDAAGADELDRRALENTATFENYAEVAALYFRLAWENNRPVEANKFIAPAAVSFH